jgi:hypothetical protein
MSEATIPLLAGLAGVNLLALLALVLAGREGRKRGSAPGLAPAAGAAAPPAIAPDLSGDPLEALVSEVEDAESAARGEERLKEDIARWRRRAAGGGDLPGAATSRRGAPGRGAAPRVA